MALLTQPSSDLSKMCLKEATFLLVTVLSALSVHGRSVLVPEHPRFEGLEKRSHLPGDGSEIECGGFLNLTNGLTMNGDIMKKVGDGYPPEHCKEACLKASDFTCVAAQVQLPAACFITGYRLRHDYYSTHFQRICDHGPDCFVESRTSSGGFTDSLPIPWYYHSYPALQSIYCMAQCERAEGCVGFDLRSDNKRPRCVFLAMEIIPDSSFELYIRRC